MSYVNDTMSYYHPFSEVPVTVRHPLANAELAIMERLWDEGPMTSRAIRERLYPGAEKPQHGTVQRLLQRLEDKAFVRRDRSLTVSLFAACVSREEYATDQLESLAERLTGGSLAPLVTHLVEQQRISRDEIERLRKLLDDADAREAGG